MLACRHASEDDRSGSSCVCAPQCTHTTRARDVCASQFTHMCTHSIFILEKSWLVYMYLRAYTRIYIYIYRTSIKIKIKLVFAPDFDGLKINQYGAY